MQANKVVNEKNPILNKEITIEGFETKNGRYKITDQNNQTFSFFTTKKDGTDTQVYVAWKAMQLGKGKTANIGYVEEEFYSEKANKNIRTKKIISFREPSQQSAPVPQKTQDDFGRRLALHGFINARLGHKEIAQVIQEIPYLLQLEDKIIEALSSPEKTIDIDDDFISDEEVPF